MCVCVCVCMYLKLLKYIFKAKQFIMKPFYLGFEWINLNYSTKFEKIN